VGDFSVNDRLMTVDENKSYREYVYEKNLNYKYISDTDLFLYFTGNSTTGNGQVIIYFN